MNLTAENAKTILAGEKLDELTERIIGHAIEVHRKLGPGLLESYYEACLEYGLQKRGLFVERQKEVLLHYGHVKIDCALKIDLLGERSFILELKSVQKFEPIFLAQIITT